MYAEIRVGNSTVMLSDEMPGCEGMSKAPATLGGTSSMIHLYVEDVDALFNKAVAAGAETRMPVTDMFWGDRYGMVADPQGHLWSIATHKQDLTPEQIAEGAAKAFGACKAD
jgi:uncharacterized glyoxalase superfamily protein PhnB